jgi:hypothetical protein
VLSKPSESARRERTPPRRHATPECGARRRRCRQARYGPICESSSARRDGCSAGVTARARLAGRLMLVRSGSAGEHFLLALSEQERDDRY